MKKKDGQVVKVALVGCFGLFLAFSAFVGFDPGRRIGHTFISVLVDMMTLLPCAFILIGLFDTWVKRETVELHFGVGSGIRGYVCGLLLAGTTVGGLYVALPVAYSLHKKGASLSVVFAYIGFSGSCRIPMAMFEASFMGMTFTIVRLAVTVPLILLSSILMGRCFARHGYELSE